MAISLNPYLNFPGNTREAMTFYHSVFGGDLTISTFSDFGMEGMPADGVMHAALVTPNLTIMASDAMPGAEQTWGGTRNYCALMGDEVETLTGWFDALAEGGTVGKPLEKMVWGDMFGDLRDQFGIEWLFNISTGSSE